MKRCPKCNRLDWFGTGGCWVQGLWGGELLCRRCPGDWVFLHGEFVPCTRESFNELLTGDPNTAPTYPVSV